MNKYRLTPEYPENWEEIRRQVLKRDNYRCGNCGSRKELHVHHIIPISYGGSHQTSNLRTLCRRCHEILHPHMKDEPIPKRNSSKNQKKLPVKYKASQKEGQNKSNKNIFSNPIVFIGIGLAILFFCVIFSPNFDNETASTNQRISTIAKTNPARNLASSSNKKSEKPTPTPQKSTLKTITGCINAKYLNIRTGPSDQFNKNGYLEEGECETFVERNAESTWVKFSKGWVILRYVNMNGSVSSLPITQNIPTPNIKPLSENTTSVQSKSTPVSLPSPTTKSKPTPTLKPTKTNCDPSYPTLCIKPGSPDLDCKDIPDRNFPVLPPDPHYFDGDRDGKGCERN